MYPSEANASAPRLNRDVATASVVGVRTSGSVGSLRAAERARVAATLSADPKFKKYAAQVDRCLQTFDNVHEWADFIAFLTKLLKTFQSHMQYKEIPRKLIVSKRLSQCLNPALPTGVHQRALDVYVHILAVVGTEGLKRDMQLWSSGLFPFFEYAATSVKPILLNMFDTYYLPLQEGLRPMMKAFILALLPGLEEETGEFFDKVLVLLDRLSGTVSLAFFFQNVWLVMLTMPPTRGTAINFLSRRLPKLSGDEDTAAIIGRDMGLMIRAFAAALEDENLLVRRGALDLLVQTLPVDSGPLKRAQEGDQRILMKAALNVVLRRDLSLNRRLYAWLLGPGADESQPSPEKIAFFREHGLELVRLTLREDMFVLHPESRPFKVFISLLDRWELGMPLVDVLLYDAIKAVKSGALQEGDGGDLLMTANTMYDAVEPLAVWKQLFAAVRSEILDGTSSASPTRFEAMSIVKFILTRLRIQDDEVLDVHLPLMLGSLLELLKTLVSVDPSKISSDILREVLQVLIEISRHISPAALIRPTYQHERTAGESVPTGPYTYACKFYEITPVEEVVRQSSRCDVLFITAFEDITALSVAFAEAITTDGSRSRTVEESFVATLTLLANLVGRLDGDRLDGLSLDWSPTSWLSKVLTTLKQRSSFIVADKVVSTVVTLGCSTALHPPLVIDERTTMFKMIDALFRFLRVDCAPYHVRAVHLMWTLENVTTHHHVESIVAQSLTSPESRNVHEAYESFGVLWRLTDDSLLPGFRFKVPMLIVLGTLKNHDPNLRRIGETWMRCSVKSYTRILEPLLYDVLDPSILRKPSSFTHNGREVFGYIYQTHFDQHRMEHLLETLLSLVKFGGQAFGRVARGTQIKKSTYVGLTERVEFVKLVPLEASCMDALLEILLRFLQSEPQEKLVPLMGYANVQIQANVIDLIQTIVARDELDGPGLEVVETAIVGKLYSAVHLDRVDLQNKLLHVLHSIISASAAAADSHRVGAGSSKLEDIIGPSEDVATVPNETGRRSSFIHANSLLAQTLIDGITAAAGRPTLQHWLDFVLMTVPQYSDALSYMVSPLSDCVCQQLRRALVDIRKVLEHDSSKSENIVSGTTDAEFIMLLNALERLVLLNLAKPHDASVSEEEPIPDRPMQDQSSGGLLGIVSNVFSSDTAGNSSDDHVSAQSLGYQALHNAVHVLYSLWALTENVSKISSIPEAESLSLIFTRARIRGRKVLERFFRARASEVMESVIECCYRDTSPDGDRSTAFEIVDILASSAQTVVHMLCESISYRSTSFDRTRKPAINPNLSDVVVFSFLEEYLSRLEGPLVVQVWGRFMALAKEIIANAHNNKLQIFPALRCINVLAEKITQTTAIDDRKIRKELQDNFVKFVDSSVLIAGRSFDQGTWIRRSTRENAIINGRTSPLHRTASDGALDEKGGLPVVDGSSSVDPAIQINDFIASRVLPNLRRTLMDNDKMAGICTNLVYYIVTPAMKTKTGRTLDVDDAILDILRELSNLPPSVKAWRNPILEAFNDNQFFSSTPKTYRKWRPIIRALIDADRQALPELLGKVTSIGSTNIFANREYETLVRSLNLRRLSYIVWCGEKNHFLTQLPLIQEKLVDILRNPNSLRMQSEIYLCLRVLLCRLSPHNLSSFWPVILTELLRLFDQVMTEPPADGSEDLQVILAASKFLDLALTLQTEEFQIHQWMFVTDTVDAVYRPDAWFPEAQLDQLAEIISDLTVPNSRETKVHVAEHIPFVEYGRLDSAISDHEHATVAMRRPLLSSVRHIANIRDLAPFFSHVSIASYEGVYHCAGNIDWDAIEDSLLGEMSDGHL